MIRKLKGLVVELRRQAFAREPSPLYLAGFFAVSATLFVAAYLYGQS